MLLCKTTVFALALLLLVGCCAPSTLIDPDFTAGLSGDEITTLSSLRQVDDYPLYTMRYQGAYSVAELPIGDDEPVAAIEAPSPSPSWACSLFAALADPESAVYGRNFDWEFSPALLLFTDPPDGYASVSMVDLAYLGFLEDESKGLQDQSLNELRQLLATPSWPFDGMNEHGLVIGMAAVPSGNMQPDPDKTNIGSIAVIRQVLDNAKDVYEAVEILGSYNIDMRGGPSIHYLIADASGRAALVEFYRGEMVVIANKAPWHLATNFLHAASGESAQGECSRYDKIHQHLADSAGALGSQDAMNLLADVSQHGTQWSVVYHMSTGDVNVVVGRQWEGAHTFHLDAAPP